MKTVLLLLLVGTVVCLTHHARADSIRQAFEKLREKKQRDYKMTDAIKGAICIRNGLDADDFERHRKERKYQLTPQNVQSIDFDYKRTRGVCWNGHGPRCSSDFLNEKECYYQQVGGNCYICNWNSHSEEGDYGIDWRRRLFSCTPYQLRTHREISEDICPYPCGCIFSGKPYRKTAAINKVQKLKVKGGSCYSKENWKQVRKVLDSWKVPKQTYTEFEMGTLMDRNDFVAFDYFIQPDKNSARYGIAFGATRCHGKNIEFGYMFTGMWEVATNAQRRCSSGGNRHSCHSTGIDNDQVELGRKTLEYYAWSNLGSTSFRSFDTNMEASEVSSRPSFSSSSYSNIFSNFVTNNDDDNNDEREDDLGWTAPSEYTDDNIEDDEGEDDEGEGDLGWNANVFGYNSWNN